MQKDLRNSPLYREAEALFDGLRRPGTGTVSDALELHASPDGCFAVFAGTLVDKLEGTPPTRICLIDLASGDTRADFRPEHRSAAEVFSRRAAHCFSVRSRPAWKFPALSFGLCHRCGADTSKSADAKAPPWMPSVETGQEEHRWRRACVYELDSDRVQELSGAEINIWEANWCGNEAIAAVASPGPGEGLWYSARLYIIDAGTGTRREVYAPEDQLGWPFASPSGKYLAVVEALCSDRWIVAGQLVLIDTGACTARPIDTRGVDITHTEWRCNRVLLLAGHRRFETVILLYDLLSDGVTEIWSSTEISVGGFYVAVSGLNATGDCVMVGESFNQPPQIGVIRAGAYHAVRSLDAGGAVPLPAVKSVQRVSWYAPDGVDIEGWLLLPRGAAPYPLIMCVHGGPVGHWRPRWLGRWSVSLMMLLERGYALFFPNPRGSAGRGKAFIRPVYGDPGGVDARDLLSGLDFLIEEGLADPARLGVTGGSYGGFMTSWLITQDSRFAAAVSMSPHNNQVTEHLLSNIPHFMSLLLQDRYYSPGGRYFERSPVMHAHGVRTPTLHICGALDRCTPPEEAAQFHSALVENRIRSVLVTYPGEGHGVRQFPASIDLAARVVTWFEEHLVRMK